MLWPIETFLLYIDEYMRWLVVLHSMYTLYIGETNQAMFSPT